MLRGLHLPNACLVARSARFVDGRNEGLVAQRLQREGTDFITYPVFVPHRLGEQALHAQRGCLSRAASANCQPFLRETSRKSALHKTQGPRKGFGAGKVGGQTSMQSEEFFVPSYNVCCGHSVVTRSGIMFVLHLFSDLMRFLLSICPLQNVT
jgi:hypothetical protein